MKPLYLQILGVVLILIIIISISMYKKKPLIEGNFSLSNLANVPSNLAIVSEKLDNLEAKMAGFTLTEENEPKLLINGINLADVAAKIDKIELEVEYMYTRQRDAAQSAGL